MTKAMLRVVEEMSLFGFLTDIFIKLILREKKGLKITFDPYTFMKVTI